MDKENLMSLDFSILYRCMHKYYDLALADLDISAGQVNFLTILSQNEGMSLVTLANICSFDKGTVTKGIQKLKDKGYVEEEIKADKRAKGLYLTSKAKSILARLFLVKNNWMQYLTDDLSVTELETYLNIQKKLVSKAKNYLAIENVAKLRFFGLQKTTLLDYPGKLAATLFTGGCNFSCPFCHNSDLVFLKEGMTELSEKEILEYLRARKNLLDGICISGGEPLLHEGLKDFIYKVKALGLLVKLDTNGYNYLKLKELIDLNLLDYVAMDIKNSPRKYALTCGVKEICLADISSSINLLKNSNIDYEFRTTIVKEFHEENDIIEIGLWLKGAKKYYLQNFRDNLNCISSGLHSLSYETLKNYQDILKQYIEKVEIRGV